MSGGCLGYHLGHVWGSLRYPRCYMQLWFLNRFCLRIKQRPERFYCPGSTILRRRFHLQNCSLDHPFLTTFVQAIFSKPGNETQKRISLESVRASELSRNVLRGAFVICKCISKLWLSLPAATSNLPPASLEEAERLVLGFRAKPGRANSPLHKGAHSHSNYIQNPKHSQVYTRICKVRRPKPIS